MHGTHTETESQTQGYSPRRNRYFYGKLLDVYHFELETNYHNAKRWLINRSVLGYGVVCGLDVRCGPHKYALEITPGIAIDKWGREIVVSRKVDVDIPKDVIDRAMELMRLESDEKKLQETRCCVQIMLCYRECLSDPTPVLAGDCQNTDPCTPGIIREKFWIDFTEHCDSTDHGACQITDIVSGGRIDYSALTKWVSRKKECFDVPKNSCIRLAHIHLNDEGHCFDDDNIDITVRPIVYTNDLLFEILLGWGKEHREALAK